MDQKKIDRINTLYHKSKAEGLTEAEDSLFIRFFIKDKSFTKLITKLFQLFRISNKKYIHIISLVYHLLYT